MLGNSGEKFPLKEATSGRTRLRVGGQLLQSVWETGKSKKNRTADNKRTTARSSKTLGWLETVDSHKQKLRF